ncbi:hypothetical protein EIP91_001844 [Steccherinum ochraceum]|uniref:F-box domain-containing protein n=1 Tax=Steccherinum ochraceum TaxID=92696 RepID=A0A4R0RFR0_9APHY|nr:hypothetical protein EIP91_001844 [Steccherinum ochraceum]
MNMDHCPVEIVAHIFSLACTDDDSTSRSLSLVSRGFRAVSEPLQFRCLAISSYDKLKGITQHLSAKPPHLRQVKHLFIDVHPQGNSRRGSGVSSTVALVVELLNIVAPDLQSCTLCTQEHWSALLPLHLPALTELTLYTHLSAQSFTQSLQAPKLKFLHIACYSSFPSKLADCFTRIAPDLTHLRISGVSQDRDNGDLLEAVASLSPGSEAEPDVHSDPPATHNMSACAFPASLRTLVVAQAATRAIRFDSVYCLYTYLASQLERLGAEDTSGRLHVLKLAPYKRATMYWDFLAYDEQVLELREQWRSRLEGGCGCWNPKQVRVIPLTSRKPWLEVM